MKKGYAIVLGAILVVAVQLALSSRTLAQAVWVEGTVTATLSADRQHHIQMGGKTYTLMKDCRVDIKLQDRPGAYIESKTDFYSIRKGQRITMMVEDYRVYQVLILQ